MTAAGLDDTIAALLPGLAAAARATHERGMTEASIATLREAGLLDIYGDGVRAWGMHMAAARLLARACAPSAWLVTQSAEANRIIGLSAETTGDIGGIGRGLAVVADAPTLALGRNPAHVAVTACAPFVPGAGFASWIVLRGPSADGPVAVVVPAAALTREPVMYAGGLRGCGFHGVSATSLSVPRHRVIALDGDESYRRAAPLGAIVGSAEGAYADYVAMTKKRVSGTGGGAVARLTQVQVRLAEADAEIAAARDSVLALAARLGHGAADDIGMARDGAMAAHRCLKAVTALVQQMGALGLAEFNPVQRHYRDLRAMATDPRVAFDAALAAYGRRELGVGEIPLPANAAE